MHCSSNKIAVCIRGDKLLKKCFDILRHAYTTVFGWSEDSKPLESAALWERRSERRSKMWERSMSAALQIFRERNIERRSQDQLSVEKSAKLSVASCKTDSFS